MALGSLIDAGADIGELRGLLRRLPLPGWELRTEPVLRGGIACTAAIVLTEDARGRRTHSDIVTLVEQAKLPPRVTDRALRVFALLAQVEGGLHRLAPADVHFHEVGGHDAVIDVVGTAAALELLDVDVVTASAIATGTGTVRSAHGMLPNPPPAVVRLLTGVPTYGRDTAVELTTPTGAALVAALATDFGPLPAMRVRATGFGAGASELAELPNCTQVVVGTATPGAVGRGQRAVVLEANVDDATGEQLARAVEALLEAGAHDAWITPVLMKKGRPGHVVQALADSALAEVLRQVLRDTTGTFGVRAVVAERWPSARTMHQVEVDGQPIAMKVGAHRAKAEFDDVLRAARRTGRAPSEVASRAEEAWRRRDPSDPAVQPTPPAR
jgi:uncharacterized protein (TIGR00299 family) protein